MAMSAAIAIMEGQHFRYLQPELHPLSAPARALSTEARLRFARVRSI
jgi:hypothetical protein